MHSFIHVCLLTSLVKTQERTQWARYELKKFNRPTYIGYSKHVIVELNNKNKTKKTTHRWVRLVRCGYGWSWARSESVVAVPAAGQTTGTRCSACSSDRRWNGRSRHSSNRYPRTPTRSDLRHLNSLIAIRVVVKHFTTTTNHAVI